MRRLVLVLVLALGASTAFAQQTETDQPRRLNTMSLREREHEMEQQSFQGASGFWTSPHKATHGAYRYRLLLIGCALVLTTGLFVSRLIKKANAERAARTGTGDLGDGARRPGRRNGAEAHAGGAAGLPQATARERAPDKASAS